MAKLKTGDLARVEVGLVDDLVRIVSMHVFITDLMAGSAQLAQERAGKLHVHAGNDGTLIVRSVSDIVFDRVSRFAMSIEQKEYFQPDGNTVADYAKLPAMHFESWNFDPNKPWKAALFARLRIVFSIGKLITNVVLVAPY